MGRDDFSVTNFWLSCEALFVENKMWISFHKGIWNKNCLKSNQFDSLVILVIFSNFEMFFLDYLRQSVARPEWFITTSQWASVAKFKTPGIENVECQLRRENFDEGISGVENRSWTNLFLKNNFGFKICWLRKKNWKCVVMFFRVIWFCAASSVLFEVNLSLKISKVKIPKTTGNWMRK